MALPIPAKRWKQADTCFQDFDRYQSKLEPFEDDPQCEDIRRYRAQNYRAISFLNNNNIVNGVLFNSAVQSLNVSEKKVDVNDFNNHHVFKAKRP